MCKLIKKLINKIMAQFTINHNGLPPFQANNITIDIAPPPPIVPFSLPINPLSNDLLGFTPTLIIDIELPVMSDEFAVLSEDNVITLEYYYYDDVTEEWVAHVMGTTFDYTIEDSYGRTDTATVTLNYL